MTNALANSQKLAEIRLEAARLEEDVLWSEKQHFAMATVWRRTHYWLGIPSTILAALAGLSAIQSYPVVAAVLALFTAILTALLTFLQPEKAAASHHASGVAYSALRGRLRRLRKIEALDESGNAAIQAKLDEFANEKQEIAKTALHIGGRAYKLARKSIENGEHEYNVDQN